MTLRADLVIRQGETWSFVWTKKDSAGAAVNLTGYTARASVKDRYNGALQAYFSTGADANGGTITLGGALGTVTMSMTATQSGALANVLSALGVVVLGETSDLTSKPRFYDMSRPVVRFIYDLELVAADGVTVTRELEGTFDVRREVTT